MKNVLFVVGSAMLFSCGPTDIIPVPANCVTTATGVPDGCNYPDPNSFVSCDVDQDTGDKRCWLPDTTDWLFGNDGSLIHENRVAASDGIHVTILCLIKTVCPNPS